MPMSNFSDKAIHSTTLASARAGDVIAHETLYRALAPAVYTTALRIVSDAAKAEDVLQDTFLEVMRSIGKFRGDASVATWVRHIAVSKSLMLIRTAWEQRSQPIADMHEPSACDPSVDKRRDLETALAQLDATSRAVVWLHDVEGFTHSEIAKYMNQSTSFSKSRLVRAHKNLRELLRDDYAPSGRRVMEPVVS